MFKYSYIKFLFIFNLMQYSSTFTEDSMDNNTTEFIHAQYETESINELKQELYNYTNFIIANNYAPGAEKLPQNVIDEIINDLLDTNEIKSTLLPIMMIQLSLRAQGQINFDSFKFNDIIDYFSTNFFYGAVVSLSLCYSIGDNKENYINKVLSFSTSLSRFVLFSSSIFKVVSSIWKKNLTSKKEFIIKTSNMLKEKKIEIINNLINVLIDSMNKKVTTYLY